MYGTRAWEAPARQGKLSVDSLYLLGNRSSGQGKSILLYRYAFEHLAPNTIFRLNACASEEHAGQIVEYLTQRLSLGLPLFVLIDSLTERTQLWYRVAAQLAGQPMRFLIATREDDWYRYGQGTNAFACGMVTPDLSLTEAQDIFHYFKRQGRVAPNIVSAEWAYARVEDQFHLTDRECQS